MGALLAAACGHGRPSPAPPASATPVVAPAPPAAPPPAAAVAAPPPAAAAPPPANFAAHVAWLGRTAGALAQGRRGDAAGACEEATPSAGESGEESAFPELRQAPPWEVLATLVRVDFTAPSGCAGAACDAVVSSLGAVLPDGVVRWAEVRWIPPRQRRDPAVTVRVDDAAFVAPLREAVEGLRAPGCAPSPRATGADFARAWPGAPDVTEQLRGYVLDASPWRPLPRAGCAAARRGASWDASYRGVAVYGRSGEGVYRVDAFVGGPWPGCVEHTIVTMPE